MTLTLQERETIILFNEQDDTAELFTYNRKLIRRLSMLAQQRPGECRQTKDNGHGGLTFVFPKSWTRVNPPRAAAPLSEEALERRRENLRRINSERGRAASPSRQSAEETREDEIP